MNTPERQLEDQLIEKRRDLKYEYRPDIRDRAALEKNFREKFNALNHVRLTERLAPTLKELVDQKNTFSVRTLNGAIQLEHFKNAPEQLVIGLYEEAGKNLLMQSVIRNLAFDRLGYYHCPHDVRQRVCSKLGIKIKTLTAAALDDDRKRD